MTSWGSRLWTTSHSSLVVVLTSINSLAIPTMPLERNGTTQCPFPLYQHNSFMLLSSNKLSMPDFFLRRTNWVRGIVPSRSPLLDCLQLIRLLHSEARLREVVLGRSTWEAADVDVSESTGDDDIVWEMVPLSVSVDLEDPSLDRSKALFYRTLDISSSMTNQPYRQSIDAHGPVRSLSC
ncbi:uncharacterized protein QC764_708584 [Podospora pseudoanserina]|uniref:Uncharacterized protein n=1 Tax=Podospora pseudoanserina TaxID=2609844 RepID=A0ABR0HL49_9PEZI|nr:hypothetical protein QC764_708584 [Podospora pseudoanserina]